MSKSKENPILELFFNEPTKHWHFKDLKAAVSIADNKLSAWLKRFVIQKLVKRVKPRGRTPYYVSNYESASYQNKKRLFSLQKFYETGFLNHLSSLDARAVILFGSFTRWDWHSGSDIDLFIYGNDEEFEIAKYQKILKRDIQLFTVKTKNDFKNIGDKLMKNIIQGDIIKGDIGFVEVKVNA
ncbi:nucleotidyltransferase domain-containing protein [Nanoarchaeota archaeon]